MCLNIIYWNVTVNMNGKDLELCHDQQGQWSRTKSVLNNEIYTLHGIEV